MPAVAPWTPSEGDVIPDIKAQAARLVEAIGTWRAGSGGRVAAVRRVVALDQPGRLVDEAGLLRAGGASAAALEVIEVQYGGLLATRASVLVVCRQWWLAPDGSTASGGTTVDVRLAKGRRRWRITALEPARPGPPEAVPAALARLVLAEPHLDLPAAARADVLSGAVHDSVLTAMLRLATRYRIGVSVVRSGHPAHVFGTDRLSDHTRGRAFDAWRVDGRLVVDPDTPRDLVTGFMAAAAAAGASNVGGPYQLAGDGTEFFTDATHHDHVHVAFAT
ncbi:MAG: hypothetical protein WKF54_03830 [Nocardioidaceae bacterium]